MTILVTGSTGHLGEALVRTLRAQGRPVVGLDLRASPHTDIVGSIVERGTVASAMRGVEAVTMLRRFTSRMWPLTRARRSSRPTSPAR